jgi:competence protein ComEC
VVETIGPAGAAQESTADPALPPAAPEAARLLHVHMLDVGQADSILIQTPGGKTIVIDGGNNADGPAIVEFLKSQGVNKIDALIGTHPHEDHIGGLDDIVESFAIGKIYMPRATANTRSYEDVLTAIQQKGLKITEAKAGVEIDAGPDVSAKLLAPLSAKYDELNDYSAVLKLTYGSTSFLFAGDAGTLSESEMVASGDNLRADVLKVGHHGSRTSSTKKFLNAVMPKVALISVGADNDYGHPAPEALDRLRAIGAEVYRTDKDGPITAVSDGSSVSVKLGE